jgi:hypothetical protein
MGMNLALGMFSAGVGIMGAKRQGEFDERSVEMEYKSDMEDIRRRAFEQEEILGFTKAFSQNAGVRHTGGSTAQGYVSSMESEFTKELTFMRKYAEEARRLGMESAESRQLTNILNSISGGMGIAGARS